MNGEPESSNNSSFQANPFNKNKRRGKKHNKKFLTNARGFANKGNFGRGSHVEEDEFKYFFGILNASQEPVDSAQDRVIMANNVLEQTVDKEIHLASNQVVSKALEQLLGFADAEHLERFFRVFGESFRPLCSDPYASYVLQKLVDTALVRGLAKQMVQEEKANDKGFQPKKPRNDKPLVTDLSYNLSAEFTEEHQVACCAFVVRVSKFLLNNLEDFVWDMCGNHLIRSCVMSLAGIHVPKVDDKHGSFKKRQKSERKISETKFVVPDEWTELVKEFPSRLQMWPQFKDLPYQPKSSGLIGVICTGLAHVDIKALGKFGKKILNDAFIDVAVSKQDQGDSLAWKDHHEPGNNDNEGEKHKETSLPEDLPSVFQTEPSVRLLETLISVAAPKLVLKLHDTLFKDRLAVLVQHRLTNFSVQRLLNRIDDKEVFEAIFEELSATMGELITLGNTGVIQALAGACLRLNVKQSAFITALQAALHCTASFGADCPKSFFACLLTLKPYEKLPEGKANYISVHGSLIIQDILQFNKPIFLVNCILEVPPRTLVDTLSHEKGSHIADTFMSSKFIGEKSREKFVKLFDGFYVDLALSMYGSRALEAIFHPANDAQKVRIAEELTGKQNKMMGNAFGRIIYSVLRLKVFPLSRDSWKASWASKTDAQPDAAEKTKKKKRSLT